MVIDLKKNNKRFTPKGKLKKKIHYLPLKRMLIHEERLFQGHQIFMKIEEFVMTSICSKLQIIHDGLFAKCIVALAIVLVGNSEYGVKKFSGDSTSIHAY
jgi:hypothetical protein